MAKQRMVNTKFWSDSWVRKLNPLDRYLFLYLLTNEHTNISGIYELPIETMAFESGIDERDLEKSMIPRLYPKVIYSDGWLYLPNFQRHQATSSKKVQKGIEIEMENIPKDTLKELEDTLKNGYPMDTLSKGIIYSNVNSNVNSNPNTNTCAPKIGASAFGTALRSKKGKKPNNDITTVVDYWKSKFDLTPDESAKSSRMHASTILKRMKTNLKNKGYPESKAVEITCALIDTAFNDPFHAPKSTTMLYIMRNMSRIMGEKMNQRREVLEV